MRQYLIIVSRDRPTLFRHLRERQAAGVQVIRDRRATPRPRQQSGRPASGAWHTTVERDGYIVVPLTGPAADAQDTVTVV